MSDLETETAASERHPGAQGELSSPYLAKPEDSYTKLAMKNMVRRGGTSLFHFVLTTLGILGLLVGLSVVFH
ncbi:MAG: DUF3285 domain-containing protein [Synechococcaceae cyanobacterium RM1_1_27]|nr:DUF3285 domain-containing protein [Synechococcaceae cyanobacterium SM2_3_2]NJO86014.1 DUF3285 domain-containing protein [Synechococcaceae cyanobacterium RM1_1_27]